MDNIITMTTMSNWHIALATVAVLFIWQTIAREMNFNQYLRPTYWIAWVGSGFEKLYGFLGYLLGKLQTALDFILRKIFNDIFRIISTTFMDFWNAFQGYFHFSEFLNGWYQVLSEYWNHYFPGITEYWTESTRDKFIQCFLLPLLPALASLMFTCKYYGDYGPEDSQACFDAFGKELLRNACITFFVCVGLLTYIIPNVVEMEKRRRIENENVIHPIRLLSSSSSSSSSDD